MSSSMIIGRTALQASQLAIQVAGNNIANAATPGYKRQKVDLDPASSRYVGSNSFIGQGVNVAGVNRMVDETLVQRVRSATAAENYAGVEASVLDQIEGLTRELTGDDISSRLTEFFNAFSELANNPSSTVTRSAVLETGARLATDVQVMHNNLVDLRTQIDTDLRASTNRASELLDEIVSVNVRLVNSEAGRAEDGGLRDLRDSLLDELSELMDITVVEMDSGAVNVYAGSEPLVDGQFTRGLDLRMQTVNDSVEVDIILPDDGTTLTRIGGRLGGLIDQREASVQATIDDLNEVATALIHEVNVLHTQTRPSGRLDELLGTRQIAPADRALAINDPTNLSFDGMPFELGIEASIPVVVTDTNGDSIVRWMPIDLDGIDSTGAAGFADDTTTDDIVSFLNTVPNVTAGYGPDGGIQITADTGYDISFGVLEDGEVKSDASGVLAALGINTFFQGEDAKDIAVRTALREDSTLLGLGPEPGTNNTALSVASLRETTSSQLSGVTIVDRWQQSMERNAVNGAGAQSRLEAAATVTQSLAAKEQAVSGVNMDEESLDLLTFQQQYNGAARFISLVDEMNQVLLSLV